MVDISDSKLKQMLYKPWSAWNLPGCSTEIDSIKLREVHKPKEPDKPRDQCNLLPHSLMSLYGTKPEIEYFSVTKCPACRSVMKSQWMAKHFKRDSCHNLVCRRTEMVVVGNRCLGKAITPLYDIKEASKDPFLEFFPHTSSSNKTAVKIPNNPIQDHAPTLTQLSPRHKHTSHKTDKTESSTSSSSANRSSKSNSSSHSNSKKHSSSNSSSSSSLNKHKSSSSKPVSNSSWTSSSSSKKDSSKSHKSHSTASYVLSIPNDDTGHNDSVESILMSNATKQTMHIVTGKTKSLEPEYEQLKFYADSSDKRSKASADGDSSRSHKLHFSPHLENFKIPLKNKTSSSSSHSESIKKSKNHSHGHTTKSGSDLNKSSIRHISSSSSSGNSNKPAPSLTIISEAPKMNTPFITHITAEVKEKSSSHSKKKKKKKNRDEPRKIIPLKERAFNPDQHCGVCVSDDSPPCTRSLTCKTHSIALRRAVPGRSNAFDSLLAAHKKSRDEEKAKSTKEVVEESKSKGKKTSSSAPLSADDSSSSSLPQPASIGKGSNSTSSGKSLGSSITFNATSLTESSSNGKHNAANHTHSSSKTMNSNTSSQRQQMSKSASTTKTIHRPVIIVDEKKHVYGMSMFDIEREPENNFVYVSFIEVPENCGNSKGLDGLTSRNHALSEWNPLDKASRKGISGNKKKGFKKPLISLFPFQVTDGTDSLDIVQVRADWKGVPPKAGCNEVDMDPDPTDGVIFTSASSPMKNSKDGSKRKISSSDPSRATAKRSRLVTCSKFFYDALQIKSQKPQRVPELITERIRYANILETRATEPEQIPEELKTQISKEYPDSGDTPTINKKVWDSLSVEAREFLQNYIKAYGTSDSKELIEKITLNQEELYEHAFELISKCMLS